MTAIDEQIDAARAAGMPFRLAVSPEALPDLQANTPPENWTQEGNWTLYRGERVHIHDEWSWGWSLIPLAQAMSAGTAKTVGLGAKPASAVPEGNASEQSRGYRHDH